MAAERSVGSQQGERCEAGLQVSGFPLACALSPHPSLLFSNSGPLTQWESASGHQPGDELGP